MTKSFPKIVIELKDEILYQRFKNELIKSCSHLKSDYQQLIGCDLYYFKTDELKYQIWLRSTDERFSDYDSFFRKNVDLLITDKSINNSKNLLENLILNP